MGLTQSSVPCHTLSAATRCVCGGEADSDEVISWREVDQGMKGSCLEQLSEDTGRFPNMSRMGQDPRVSGQGLILIDSCSRCGEVWLRYEHQSESHNSGRKQHCIAGPLLASLLHPPLTSDCIWPFNVDERPAASLESSKPSGLIRTAEHPASWTEQLPASQVLQCVDGCQAPTV